MANACLQFNRSFVKPDFSKATYTMVDDRLRYIFCFIPKVACTTWKRVLLMLTGKIGTNNAEDVPRPMVHSKTFVNKYLSSLNNYRPDEIENRLKNYFKFMFVRHPFERIVSAYLDKFVRENNFQTIYGTDIIKRYRPNATEESLKEGRDVTFEEFVRHVVDSASLEDQTLNEHWQKFYLTCHPCSIQYDFIGKFETLHEDAEFVLKRFAIFDVVSFH